MNNYKARHLSSAIHLSHINFLHAKRLAKAVSTSVTFQVNPSSITAQRLAIRIHNGVYQASRTFDSVGRYEADNDFRLGGSGLKISKVILGAMSYGTPEWQEWVLDEEKSLPLLEHAYNVGLNTWDTVLNPPHVFAIYPYFYKD